MGSDNFFSKIASVDPLAQALNLPGAHKYAQAVAQRNAGATDTNGGAYTGIAPTLAAANAGYAPGGPGAPVGWTQQNGGSTPGGVAGFLTKAANLSGNLTPQGTGTSVSPAVGPSTGNPYVQQNNPQQNQNQSAAYVNAARGSLPGNPYGQ